MPFLVCDKCKGIVSNNPAEILCIICSMPLRMFSTEESALEYIKTLSITPSPKNIQQPSKMWYVGHFFLWIITGLICYVIWKDKNPEAARKHLIHSIWIGIVGMILTIFPFWILPFSLI